MSRRTNILAPLAVLALAGAAAALLIKFRRPPPRMERPKPLPVVRVLPLTRTNLRFWVESQGTVRARTRINLTAEVSGKVVYVAPAFDAGGFFEEGEVLARIDPRDYELALTRAKATLAQAQVRLQQEEAEAEVAREEWEDLGRGEPSPLLLRKPQLAEARAAVESAKAAVAAAKLDLDRCVIRAPFAGRVRTKLADVGQFVARGAVLAEIYAVDYAEVGLPLPLSDLAFVELPIAFRGETPRAHPRVFLSAEIGGRLCEWEGRIDRTEGEINARTRMLTAVARVADPYGRKAGSSNPPLAAGLFVRARIEGKVAEGVFVAPRAAFRDERHLMTVDAQSRMHLRAVKILRRAGGQVVFRGEIQPGDRACATPLEAVTEGMRVRPQEETAASAASKEA